MKRLRAYYTRLATALLSALLLMSCSKYTAPSPLDGIWSVEEITCDDGTTPQVPGIDLETSIIYFDFKNVLYTVGTIKKETSGYIRKGWGNVYFHRDEMRLVPDERNDPYFPVPGNDGMGKELTLKYKVWKGKLELSGNGYTLHLKKR
ncbi:MAG: hypothetical protein Q4D93_05130 [Porphyromonas sp.]|nr:hypothetical protein [Porphyromonas sp.]